MILTYSQEHKILNNKIHPMKADETIFLLLSPISRHLFFYIIRGCLL